MKASTPCTRHSHVWIAQCPDCTAWHLPLLIAGRAAADARGARSPVVSSPSLPPALHPAA
jgi:hypothetical protein